MDREEKIKIGRIVSAVGLKGEVKVYSYASRRERFEELGQIFVETDLRKVEHVRYQNRVVILKLSGVSDRTAAEALAGRDLFITAEDLPELPADTYYVRDLLGMAVELTDGAPLGVLTDVIQASAQDLYEVELTNGKKLLIPAVEAFITDIDVKRRVVSVKLIEGMLELQH